MSQKIVSKNSKTYFDQNDVKSINGTRSLNSNSSNANKNQTEANLFKYVEDYKTKKYGIKQQQKPEEHHTASFRQAKMVLYESLLGHNNQNRGANILINMSRDYGISNKTDVHTNEKDLRPTAKGYKFPKSEAISSKNESLDARQEQINTSNNSNSKNGGSSRQNISVFNLNGMRNEANKNKKRKSLNIDTSHMLLLQKHQLNMKVNSAFKYTKMLDESRSMKSSNRRGGGGGSGVEDFVAPLSFHFPNSKADSLLLLHHSESQSQPPQHPPN